MKKLNKMKEVYFKNHMMYYIRSESTSLKAGIVRKQ